MNEILSVPEEDLEEVIGIIRAGLAQSSPSQRVSKALTRWCDEEEEYVRRWGD